MPEAIQNIIDILQKIWQGIIGAGFFQTAYNWAQNAIGDPGLILETAENWLKGLNDWLSANAGVSLKEILKAFANLFIWLFKSIMKIIQLIVELLEKLNG